MLLPEIKKIKHTIKKLFVIQLRQTPVKQDQKQAFTFSKLQLTRVFWQGVTYNICLLTFLIEDSRSAWLQHSNKKISPAHCYRRSKHVFTINREQHFKAAKNSSSDRNDLLTGTPHCYLRKQSFMALKHCSLLVGNKSLVFDLL